MDCQFIDKNNLHEKYILNRLTDSDKQQFEKHLRECAACRKEQARQKRLIAGIRTIGRTEMKEEIRRQVVGQEAKTRPSWVQWARVAAVVFVIIGTSSVYLLIRKDDRRAIPTTTSEVRQHRGDVDEQVQTLQKKETSPGVSDEERPLPPEPSRVRKQSALTSRPSERPVATEAPKKESDSPESGTSDRPAPERIPTESESVAAYELASRSHAAEEAETIVRGKVTDQRGNPLPGANVIISGTNLGTATDTSGNYTLTVRRDSVLAQPLPLESRFIGYQTQSDTLVVSGKELTQNFVLQEAALAMDAITVTGSARKEPDRRMSVSPQKGQVTSDVADSLRIRISSVESAGRARQDRPDERVLHTNGKLIRVRLHSSASQLTTDSKTSLPQAFPVTIVSREPSELVMDWRVPSNFLPRLEGAVVEMVGTDLLHVVLKTGHAYEIDLRSDGTQGLLKEDTQER